MDRNGWRKACRRTRLNIESTMHKLIHWGKKTGLVNQLNRSCFLTQPDQLVNMAPLPLLINPSTYLVALPNGTSNRKYEQKKLPISKIWQSFFDSVVDYKKSQKIIL